MRRQPCDWAFTSGFEFESCYWLVLQGSQLDVTSHRTLLFSSDLEKACWSRGDSTCLDGSVRPCLYILLNFAQIAICWWHLFGSGLDIRRHPMRWGLCPDSAVWLFCICIRHCLSRRPDEWAPHCVHLAPFVLLVS